jgi:hypothetical protein
VYKPVPPDYEALIPDSLKTIMEFPGYTADTLSQMRQAYAHAGGLPSHTRYGWLRARA